MKKSQMISLFTLLLLALAMGCATTREQAARPAPSATELAKGYRFERAGWIYVHIEGEPYERGYQYGRLVAPELKEIQRAMRHNVPISNGISWEFFIKEARKQFAKKIDAEFTAEIQGIADGARAAGTDICADEVLAWNGQIDLIDYWWPRQDKTKFAQPDQDHCSAFAAAGPACAPGVGTVLAHNTWGSYTWGQFFNLILDVKPARGHRILMQAAPGLLHSGTDFAVTDAGLAITETTIGGFDQYDAKGTPEFFRFRKAAQYAETMDDFVKILLDKNNGGYANSWLLSDAKTGEVMRFELGLKVHNVERTRAGSYIGFNGAVDPKLRHLEAASTTNDDIRNAVGARRVRLTELMEQYQGKLDAEAGKRVLSDHFDVYLNKDNPGGRTVDGHYELDRQEIGGSKRLPYNPGGSYDGKIIDTDLAKKMSFWARWGCSCGRPFDAKSFVKEHRQWSHLDGYLKDRPTQPWVLFTIDDKPAK